MAEVEIPERYEARRLLDAVQAGALLLEPLSGRVLYANQAALALLGLAASQVLGRSLAELGALRALDGSPVMGIGPLSGEVELLAVRHQGPCVPVLASCRECGGSGAAGLVLATVPVPVPARVTVRTGFVCTS